MSFPKRVLSALNYNEQKVQRGVAQCIGAHGYLRAAEDMNVHQKLEGLQRRNALNDRATTRTLHVSLNFDPSETLTSDTLLQIASGYMERIGFGEQPYLVYQHHDAGHPHLHIVSTLIREDGGRIPTHNLGRNGSEKARRELEMHFGLVRAEGRKKAPGALLQPVRPHVVRYGKAETKRSIAAVVHIVWNRYAFSSLPEYNAALRAFNVVADRGKEAGRIYRQGGLVYRIVDESGEKVGVPIKASALPGPPTLKNLQGRFAAGEKRKGLHKAVLKEKLERCFSAAPASLAELREHLTKEGVYTLPRRNEEGRLYGITFVDHQTRCVWNGSDLGKGYSAVGIGSRLDTLTTGRGGMGKGGETKPGMKPPKAIVVKGGKGTSPLPAKETVLDLLLAPGAAVENVPVPLLPRKKRKKKRTPGNE